VDEYRLRNAELEDGEAILDHWVAGLPSKSGRTAKYGGTLVLTNKRLIWDPISVPGTLPGDMGGPMFEVREWRLADVTGVEPDSRRVTLLHIDTSDGRQTFLVSASRMAPIWSKKNGPARDAAVTRILASLG
jgi:hypothetical protein